MILNETVEAYENAISNIYKVLDDKGELNIQNLLINYRNFTISIQKINSIFKSINNDFDKIIYQEVANRFQKQMVTFQKLTDLVTNIISTIISQQIIMTNNNIDNKYKIISVSDNDIKTIEEALNVSDIIIDFLKEKTYDEIIEHFKIAKEYVAQNEKLYKQKNIKNSNKQQKGNNLKRNNL